MSNLAISQSQQNYITKLMATCDPKALPSSAYWDIRAEFQINSGSGKLMLLSDCNSSLYVHSRPDVARNMAAEMFDCWDIKVTPIDSAKVTIKGWNFGKQSDKRYMSPTSEGCLYVTVESSGVMINGLRWLEKMEFKIFIVGIHCEQSALNCIKSVASEKLISAMDAFFN
ncbi:hypothetical protein OCF84_21585 (plasmid) [Shewanella xiamenensis]|uniref:Uncharacterized protein n=1 Tax=Shewanella xiamenensis TaxID=332186 RepID=A0ABT6UGZ1_9GAMM|nr:hypothetical protein [Shewanella xiamenensis]MDI5832529.1 hypothetical protein [Shewanella xiamenensis]WHF57852.1 hypothetical protein OCF84_21585 [Shewanella xiamenensis]